MFLEQFSNKKHEKTTASLEDVVIQAQAGNEETRNQLIIDYQPFIAKVASRVCKRYIDPQTDDAFSIGLQGFNEAIEHYSPSHNARFLTFAEMVIKRRLIDYLRREKRYQVQVPLTSFDSEDDESNVINPIENDAALDVYQRSEEANARKTEIERLIVYLSLFDISLDDLVRLSPKHRDSRIQLFQIARLLAGDQVLADHLLETRTLPIKQLLACVNVSRKTLERHRKYIIAMFLVYYYSLPYMQDYLRVPADE